jgi:DNA-directed RNA polymerase subunit alpha
MNDDLNTKIEAEFAPHKCLALRRQGFAYLGDLAEKTEAELSRMLEPGLLNEVKNVLTERGLRLGMDVRGWRKA